MNRKDLAKTLKFSTVPREAPIAGTLVSIYEGPIIGREEVWMGTGQDLDDYIRLDLLSMHSSLLGLFCL